MRCSNCSHEMAPKDRFCAVCGVPRPARLPRFAQAEQRFAALKARYDAGQLNEAAFDAEMHKLVLQSESGYWMLGADSGEWYWYDGRQWLRRDPPAADGMAPAPAQPARVQQETATSRVALAAAVLFVVAVIAGTFLLRQTQPAPSPLRLPATATSLPATATPRPATPVPLAFVPIVLPTATPTAAPAQARTATPAPAPAQRTTTLAPKPVSHIAFVSKRDGDDNIYKMNPDGSGVVQFTARLGQDWYPSWSPDGQRLVYQRAGQGSSVFNIAVEQKDGSVVEITQWTKSSAGAGSGARRPVWSPDGKSVAASVESANMQQDIMVMGIDGSNQKRIAAGIDPTWSPDGQRLAFSARASATAFELFSIKPDGTGLAQLTTLGAVLSYPAWSPNGKYIAFVQASGAGSAAGSAIDILDVSTGTTREIIKKSSQGLAWSPDSTQVLYGPAGEGLWAVNVDGTRQLKQISKDGIMPAWSP
jgi:hypothetical protein